MAQAMLGSTGGLAISTWTVHCSRCGSAVAVAATDAVSTCSTCGAPVRAEGLPTAVGTSGPAPAADTADSLLGTRLGRYRVERLLGRGGMGRVYEAADADAPGGRRVALKVLADTLAADPHFVRRFQREAKVLATLSHPHLVEVLDQGEDDGRLWFAMEYVRGENLRRRLERGPLPVAEALRVAGEIASALSYAHERGVVHRDLKPENVLLGEDGRVRLADFGLLRLARESAPEATTRLTRTDVILGTYEYMAPEQRRGSAEVDGRADVFALGVMLYECLTGRLPLGRFRAASEMVPGVSRALDAAIHQALAPEPRERPASAQAFMSALKAARTETAAPAAASEPAPSAERPPPAPPWVSDDQERDDARVLNHVEVLALLDKVAAILLIVIGGVLSLALVGIPLLVGGILLLHVARRLRTHQRGAREAQIAANIVLLFLFPLGTALGVYGLIVVAPRAAADALDRERARRRGRDDARERWHAWSGSPPAVPFVSTAPFEGRRVRRVELLVPESRRPAGVLLRLLLAAAVVWTLAVGLVATRSVARYESQSEASSTWRDVRGGRSDAVRVVHAPRGVPIFAVWSLAGVAVSALAARSAWRRRRERRGVGLAFTALGLFVLDALAPPVLWFTGVGLTLPL